MAKLRIGFMSTAKIGNKNLVAIRETDSAEVIAVASRSLDKAKQWAAERSQWRTMILSIQ